MNTDVQAHLETFVQLTSAAGPEGWVRLVVWRAFLAEDDGSVPRSANVQVGAAALVPPGGGPEDVRGEDFAGDPQADFELDDLDAKLAGEPEQDWTVLRIEIDRDGAYRADFSHEPARSFEGSSTDSFFDEVHEYADRHHDDLVQLATRLAEQGDPAAPDGAAGNGSAGGRLGKLFGRG